MHVGPSRKRLTRILLWAAPLTWLGCGGGSTDIVLPSLTITTSTDGVELDADGYSVAVDGGSPQAIGLDATVTVDPLPDGQHTVELSGVAANCSAVNNPRTVTVSAGGTATAAFAITCAASTGTIAVTTTTSGPGSDSDGFALTVDGGDRGAIALNATVSLNGLGPGPHSVGLAGLATNCRVSGTNPVSVTVSSGQTSQAAFAVTCAVPVPNPGSLQITITTSGSNQDPDGYSMKVDGGAPQDLTINDSRTIQNLSAGPHSVQLSGLATNCTVSGGNPRTVTVTTDETATITFAVTCVATGPSLNLRIQGMYFTQSTQTLAGTVPLVAGRAAYLRVFVVSDKSTTAKPSVRVTLRNGSATTTRMISAAAAAVPTSVQEGSLGSSWNLPIEASLIQPGLSISAEVDPENAIAETNEADNTYPSSGTPQQLAVHAAAVAKIRFVPVQQGSAAPGNVSDANKDALVETARRIYPLHTIDTDVRAVYTTSTLLEANGNGWNQVLTEIEGLRVAEGTDRTYYGVAKLAYPGGLVGLGFVGVPSAMGTDNPLDVVRVVAHELGHTWGQLHTPCGAPPNIDPNYPYGNGIGVYGFDVTAGTLKPPSTPDIMGYCSGPWISDYIYQRVLTFRETSAAITQASVAAKQPALLVWGRIVNGQPMLEPAFQVVTRPNLPTRPGPYTVEGIATDGTSLFRLSFEAAQVPDDPSGSRHFAFAVPLDAAGAAKLSDLRLTGPGATTASTSLSLQAARKQGGPVSDAIVARRELGAVALEWNPSAHPMIMVRDPDSGEILSFARGGKARIVTSKGTLDLVVSDQVRSQTRRITVQ